MNKNNNSFAWNDTIHKLNEMEMSRVEEASKKFKADRVRVGKFTMSDNGYIRFDDNKMGCTTDCAMVLAFADVIYREVEGKEVRVTIKIEEI